MGPDGVAVICGGQPAVGALAGKYIEMVAPEVDHDFIKLAPAVYRAHQPGKLQLENHLTRSLHLCHFHAFGLSHSGLRIELEKLATAQTHGFELGDFTVDEGISDLLGAELLVEVSGDPQLLNL